MYMTFVIVDILDGSGENPDLAKEYCDQKGGAGRIGGGGKQV